MVQEGQERVVGRCWRVMGTLDHRDTLGKRKYRQRFNLNNAKVGAEIVWGQGDCLLQEL